MKRTLAVYSILFAFALVPVIQGCSVYKAANQPSEKNIGLFTVGTSRSALLAEFGNPIASEMKSGKRVEVYKFTQGYSSGAKGL